MDDENGVTNRYNEKNRPKPKKIKDPEKKLLLSKGSYNDLTIDMGAKIA